MTVDEFKALVTAGDARAFVVHQLFVGDCWLFNQPRLISPGANYGEFKSAIADLLGITPMEIAVVGSGKFGWSMSPKKGAKAFNALTSDIDIAIVSPPLFENSWSGLRAAYYAGYSHYKEKHAYHVFARSLVLDGNEKYKSTYVRELARKLADLNAVVNRYVRLKEPAKYRIYADWADATNYHQHSLESFRRKLANGNA